ncbi:hypothetical protein SPACI_038000 [Sporomusa acidovorans DSM 3132]|uniref:Peptidase C45 hydrolase domain-containing protein n=2 Tax=Sporomusa TaxID=2375 RepID=A0ABZ3J6M1_SPOA4|nr:C45 family peptidase [Sporomusa acidovorans]OZC24317.1 acyl-coenzyme A:6-aminopenicillanic acid acyl-transferase [Sporomusa acidovorans DSM 3132]SDF02200.1 Predicted choloylglycine hydrolase [Sporomusa acidovorans]
MKIETRTIALVGSNYEIGAEMGRKMASMPSLKKLQAAGLRELDNAEVKKAAALFDRWCPGLNEELQGFVEAIGLPLAQVVYYGMTYLRPNCSQIAVLPSMTKSGRPLLARNYEFSHEAEDFTLVKTSVTGKYTHLGTSVLQFGRDDGFNECGLAVTVTSCGFPVGPLQYMRKPKVVGLQFWAVVRTLLENCRDVNEALAFMADMPIAYNLNLMLLDKAGNVALVETLDGQRATKRIGAEGDEAYLCTTNHPVLPEMISYEPRAMRHSVQRYKWIRQRLDGADDITSEDLKAMLLAKYPDGLCCYFFNEFFGTTKSMVIDPACGTLELCWGGRRDNGWHKYNIQEPLNPEAKEIEISFDQFNPEIAVYIPLDTTVKS